MNDAIKIGTRDSKLALWQANSVKKEFEKLSIPVKIIKIKSDGDINQITPLYEFGVIGVFTKNLDSALLNNDIDVAVHSLKDVPIKPAKGLEIKCVLKRGNPKDVLLLRNNSINYLNKLTIATSSIRRKCQWLYKYPKDNIKVLRGNVDTRIKKLRNSNWDGAIFAKAGIDRLGIDTNKMVILDWMVPSAAQGTIAIASRRKDKKLINILEKINCQDTMHLVNQERKFLKLMGGGCSMPISVQATYSKNSVIIKTNICSLDCQKSLTKIGTYARTDVDAGLKIYKKNIMGGSKEIIK